jgi:hypothetical protein
MKTIIIIPPTPGIPKKLTGRHQLKLDTDHAMSHYGSGVLLDKDGEILDGARFVHLRDALGASIESTNPERVVRALGLPSDPMPSGISRLLKIARRLARG